MSRRTITIERTYNAAIDDVWTLWTTADGIESWWGPDGFRVKVRKLELRAGGALHYDMASALPYTIAAQIAFPNRQCVAFVGDGGFSMPQTGEWSR